MLQCLKFEVLLETLDNEIREYIQSIVQAAGNSFFEDQLNIIIENEQSADLLDRYNMLIAESAAKLKTFFYWSIYIRMAGKVH